MPEPKFSSQTKDRLVSSGVRRCVEAVVNERLDKYCGEHPREARRIVGGLLAGLPTGSYLVQCDGTDSDPDYVAALERYRDSGGVPYNVRGHEQIESFYDGLEVVEPGVVQITRWRPDANAFGEAADVSELGGVARKP